MSDINRHCWPLHSAPVGHFIEPDKRRILDDVFLVDVTSWLTVDRLTDAIYRSVVERQTVDV